MFRILALLSLLLLFFNCGAESSSKEDVIQFGESLYYLSGDFKPTMRVVVDRESKDDIKFECLVTLRNKDGNPIQLKTLKFDIVDSVTIKNFTVEPQENVIGGNIVTRVEISKVSLNNSDKSLTYSKEFQEGLFNSSLSPIKFGNSLYYKDASDSNKPKIDFVVKKTTSGNIPFKSLLTLKNSSGNIVQLKNLDFTIDRSTDIETFVVEPKGGLIGANADVATAEITDIELNGVVTGATHNITLGTR